METGSVSLVVTMGWFSPVEMVQLAAWVMETSNLQIDQDL